MRKRKLSNNAFNILDIRSREQIGQIIVGKLGGGSKVAMGEGGRGVLVAFGSKMFEFLEGLSHVAIHGAAKFAAWIIPTEVNADVLFSSTVNFESVFRVHDGFQVLQIFILCVLDTKIVNNKGEGDIASFVEEKAISVGGLDVAVFAEMLDKFVMGNFARLFESIPRLFLLLHKQIHQQQSW